MDYKTLTSSPENGVNALRWSISNGANQRIKGG